MASRSAVPAPLTDVERSRRLYEQLSGFSLAAGGANVIMQLSQLPVGHGVAKSPVESGRVDRHPLKRLRTTAAYLVITAFGTDDERRALAREIDRVHARVVSGPDDPVAYRALDPKLQLWVAACLYKGVEDVLTALHGQPSAEELDQVWYPHAARLATTLQVPEADWPATRDDFEELWQAGLTTIEMDEVTRPFLQSIAELGFLVEPLGPAGRPLRPLLAPIGRLLTLGFLHQPFRDELGLPWDDGMQRRFDRIVRVVAALDRRLPGVVRRFPLNLYLWDTRRRIRTGHPVL